MNTTSLVRLLLLSAIWGASFLFMRIGAPVLGPEMLVFARVLLAAIFLLLVSPGFAASLQTHSDPARSAEMTSLGRSRVETESGRRISPRVPQR